MAQKKISELSGISNLATGDFLVAVDTSEGKTKKINFANVKKTYSLDVAKDNLENNSIEVVGPAFATATDGAVFFLSNGGSVSGSDHDFEEIFLTSNGEFTANIELADSTGIVLGENVIGQAGGIIKIGNNTDVAEELPSIPKVSMLKPTRHEFNAATVGSGDYRKFDEDFSFSYTLGNTSGDSKKFMAETSLSLISSNGAIDIESLQLVLEVKLTKDIGTLGFGQPSNDDGTSLNVVSSLINFSNQVVQTGTLPTLGNNDFFGPPTAGFPASASFPYLPYSYSESSQQSGILLLNAPSLEITPGSAANIYFKSFFEHKQVAETATGLSYDVNFYIRGDNAHPTDFFGGKIMYTNSSLVVTEL